MAEFNGYISSIFEAIIVIEASVRGELKLRTSRPRYSDIENIKAGTTIVFDETETGIKRWIDGKLWSPSRLNGGFFIYQEIVGNTNVSFTHLAKKVVSVIAPNGHHLHLVNYYSPNQVSIANLSSPLNFPFRDIHSIKEATKNYWFRKNFRSRNRLYRQTDSNSSRTNSSELPTSPRIVTSPYLKHTFNSPTPVQSCSKDLMVQKSCSNSLPSLASFISYQNISHNSDPKYYFKEDVRQLNALNSFLTL